MRNSAIRVFNAH